MSLQLQGKRARVLSAHYPASQQPKPRPFSGVSSHTHQRPDPLQKVYVSQGPVLRLSSGKSQRYEGERGRAGGGRDKEQLAEEVMCLKQLVNRLTEELAQQRGQVESMRRRSSKYAKALTVQFENQQQWSSQSGSHLVTGIKAMYEALKEKLQAKTEEHALLLAKVQTTNLLESAAHLEALEKDHQHLARKLAVLKSPPQMLLSNDCQRQASGFLLAELRAEKEELLSRVGQLELKAKRSQESVRSLQKKVDFLEKLTIEKDNCIHALQKKNKLQAAEVLTHKAWLAESQRQLQELVLQQDQKQEQHLRELQQLRYSLQMQREGDRSRLQQSIRNLEKNNLFYQSGMQQMQKQNLGLKVEVQDLRDEIASLYKLKHEAAKQPLKQDPGSLPPTSRLSLPSEQQGPRGPRVRRRADRRHQEQSAKARKVQEAEVCPIAELIKYRMVVRRMPVEGLLDLFSNVSGDEWVQEYISMGEAVEVLSAEPIGLDRDSALLLARYLIEDVDQEFVYSDLLNENHRSVVRAILKALIGPYAPTTPPLEHIAKEQLRRHGQNLQSALEGLFPEGTVPRERFESVLKSVGADSRQQVVGVLLGWMAVDSSSMLSLTYSCLF